VRITMRRALCGAAGAVLAAGVLAAVAPTAALAATTPGWEPDPNAQGSIALYDAAGNVVTSGQLDASPTVKYAVASGPGVTGDTKAVLFLALPQAGVDPSKWSKDSLTATTSWPVAGAPAVVANSPDPVSTGADGDLSFADIVGEFPNTSTDPAYANLYELRLSSAPSGAGHGVYYRLDIAVNTSADTWSVVYPVTAGPAATVTALASDLASPQDAGTAITLTATVNPAAAGAVEFFDGTTDLGAGTYDAATGKATLKTTPASGDHSFTAKFTPADATAFAGSTSSALAYTVNKAATPTSAALSVSPDSGTTADASGNLQVTLTAKVTPTALDGSLHFFDGATDLGVADSYTASTGVGAKTTTLTAGSHELTATFTPSDAIYAKSVSPNVAYEVVPQNMGTAQIQVSANDATAPYAGNLVLSVGSNTTSALTQVDPATSAGHPVLASDATGHRHAWVFTGALNGISVQDTRPSEAGWKVTGQATVFTNGNLSIPAADLGWDPKLAPGGDAEKTVVAGTSVASKLANDSSAGLTTPVTLASAAAGNGLGTENLGAGLELRIPDTSPTGTYSSTLTLTLINP
jgi:hypothetical protein